MSRMTYFNKGKFKVYSVKELIQRHRMLAITLMFFLSGCSTARLHHYVLAATYSANYSEDRIDGYSILTGDGRETGLGGSSVQKFSEGGVSGTECCSLIPGVGKNIRVVWNVQNPNDNTKSETYSKDVVVLGKLLRRGDSANYLLVRFFPGHQVEVEMLRYNDLTDCPDPRTDQLFYGNHVMRHLGE